MYRDMYLGTGKDNPSITTRLKVIEDTLDRVCRNLDKATWLAYVAILGLIADIVRDMILGHLK